MQAPTFARGFVAGLRKVEGKDDKERNQTRVFELLNVLNTNRELDKETICSLVTEVYQRYFQSNSGAFSFASRIKKVLDETGDQFSYIGPMIEIALTQIGVHMCDNLNSAAQMGNMAVWSMDIAFWVAKKLCYTDRIAAERIVRTCGKMLSGHGIDQFFWQLKAAETEDRNLWWAVRALSEGMLVNEGSVAILADRLLASGRGF